MTVDEYGRKSEDRAVWREATSLKELGELMAQWVEGKITYQPAYFAQAPADETAELVEVLAGVNRAGLVTTFSQPGRPWVDGRGQRASIDGFCTKNEISALQRLTLGTDLILIVFSPGCQTGGQVPVTVMNGGECTWLGLPLDGSDIDDYYHPDLCDRGIRAIREAWQIHLIDTVWGRNDLLWDYLREFVVRAPGSRAEWLRTVPW
jgi:hypothetical protein